MLRILYLAVVREEKMAARGKKLGCVKSKGSIVERNDHLRERRERRETFISQAYITCTAAGHSPLHVHTG